MSDKNHTNVRSLSKYSRKVGESNNEGSKQNRFECVREDVLSILNSTATPNQLLAAKKRWRFSIGIVLLSIFVLILSFILPDNDQWFWASVAFFILLVGAWQFDKSNHEMVKARRNIHSG
jgi:hypothetical protein